MKLFLIYSFLIFCLSVSLTSAQTKDTLSIYYYNKGLRAISINDLETAKDLFKKSVREEANAPAEYELAKIYMADTSHSMWNISREHIKNAVKLDPNNVDYRIFYGKLSEALFKMSKIEFNAEDDAIRQYEKALELDSSNVYASIRLGEIKSKEFLEFNRSRKKYDDSFDKDSITTFIRRLQSEGFRRLGRTKSQQLSEWRNLFEIDLDGFVQKDFNYAVKALDNAIKYDSLNSELYLKISSILEDRNLPEKGIPYLQRLEKFYPNSKEAHLNLGILYYRSEMVDSAYVEYQRALNLMSESERIDFTYNSVKILLDPYLKDKVNDLTQDQLKNVISSFWKSRDPLNLTQYNERLLEHYTRVAYANLRFSVPTLDKIGWKTDRGYALIKYGFPPARFRYRSEMRLKGTGFQGMAKTDVWVYGDKTFAFDETSFNGNFQFGKPGRQHWDDTQEFIDDLQATQPDDYVPVFNGPVFDVPYKAIQFKDINKSNLTDVIVSYGIDVNNTQPGESKYKYDHKTGVYFFDKYFNKIADNIKTIEYLNTRNKIIIPDSGNFIVSSIEMKAQPDSGNMSFEILRTADKGVAAYHGKYEVKNYNNNSLSLSDILLASNINRNSEEDGRIKRKDISILPNPTGIFSEDQDLYIYYEVYNLEKNVKGLTDFKQNIILQRKDNKGIIGKVFSPILKVVGINSEEKQVSLTSDYQTKDKDSQIYLQLDMTGYESGNYVLTIKIKDNIAGKETEQSTELTWK